MPGSAVEQEKISIFQRELDSQPQSRIIMRHISDKIDSIGGTKDGVRLPKF